MVDWLVGSAKPWSGQPQSLEVDQYWSARLGLIADQAWSTRSSLKANKPWSVRSNPIASESWSARPNVVADQCWLARLGLVADQPWLTSWLDRLSHEVAQSRPTRLNQATRPTTLLVGSIDSLIRHPLASHRQIVGSVARGTPRQKIPRSTKFEIPFSILLIY